jgi:cysteine-rich repeat protein
VLILGSTVGPANPSLEESTAAALGYTVVVDSDAQWLARTTADFASFQAIILGDPTCGAAGSAAAAEANRTVWSPAITGNVVVIGTDPTYHSTFGAGGAQGGDQVAESGISFAASDDQTGAYITLSCYYDGAPPLTPVPLLDQFGDFRVQSAACWNDAHIVASHEALAGLTDASLSNWACSSHEVFNSFPGDFLALVIAENYNCPGTGTTFGDGTCGTPYVLARGEELVPAACGDGNLDFGEECDDGNVENGDSCSAQCTIERPPTNSAPICSDATATPMIWPPNHKMVPVGITGVTDPDGDDVAIKVTTIRQDEPTNTTGDGNTWCDAEGIGGPAARVRAERSGNNDGRFYHVAFTATDREGATCTGVVALAVPRDRARPPVDQGPLYNSCTR